jgi:hypothetical protein
METSLFRTLVRAKSRKDAALFAVLLGLGGPNLQRNKVPGQEAANARVETFFTRPPTLGGWYIRVYQRSDPGLPEIGSMSAQVG